MVAGRRPQTTQNDNPSSQEASNSSGSRNLSKRQLGGVIFGCKNATINECLSKQLFGLPAQHFSYVKNIEQGLPLFLFNYSDRRLHGIFEAASSGQMNINPYGWTSDGSQKTLYPAQVQIRVRLQCHPLQEEQFKPIIMDNYYSHNHFWFELDHLQTSKLTSKLSSLAFAPRTYTPKNTETGSTMFRGLPPKDKREDFEAIDSQVLSEDFTNSGSTHGGNKPLEESLGCQKAAENEKDFLYLKLREMALSRRNADAAANKQVVEAAPSDDVLSNDETSEESRAISEKTNDKNDGSPFDPSDPSFVQQLLQGMEELNAFKTEQTQKMSTLEQKLEEAEREIQQLKYRCIMLESLSNPSTGPAIGMVAEAHDEIDLDISQSIFLIGGFNGIQWLSALDLYSPSLDVVKSLAPMHSVRSYGTTAKLNGEIYVLGGGDKDLWYDTVESYNPAQNQWTMRPSLSSKKGSLAAATLEDKIYALGGGDGTECFSSVEIFDAHVGRWIPTRSMLQRRFGLGSADLNGALYAVGGFDGTNYLKSAERFDPREHSWTKIESMSTNRGCHSLFVMDEKIYALGGYDGSSMVASMEIYDPRLGKWMMGEPMDQPRGYLSAAVLKDTVFIIGGVKSGIDIIPTVESYKEGEGWKTTNLREMGLRCFCSTMVLDAE